MIWSLFTFFVLSIGTMISFNSVILRKNLSEDKLFMKMAKDQVDYVLSEWWSWSNTFCKLPFL